MKHIATACLLLALVLMGCGDSDGTGAEDVEDTIAESSEKKFDAAFAIICPDEVSELKLGEKNVCVAELDGHETHFGVSRGPDRQIKWEQGRLEALPVLAELEGLREQASRVGSGDCALDVISGEELCGEEAEKHCDTLVEFPGYVSPEATEECIAMYRSMPG